MVIVVSAAVFLALLWAACSGVRVGSLAHRALSRCAGAVWAAAICQLFPMTAFGLNIIAVLAAAALGLPGLALLQVVALMR